MKVQSEIDRGTEFRITFDFEKAAAMEVDMVLPSWNMLVVDDDELLCRTAMNALKSIGIKAEWTLSGEKAIDLVIQHHIKRDDYQIILLDWKLPGMNGIQTAKEIRRNLGDEVPILLISAYDWSEFEAEAREAGISGFIPNLCLNPHCSMRCANIWELKHQMTRHQTRGWSCPDAVSFWPRIMNLTGRLQMSCYRIWAWNWIGQKMVRYVWTNFNNRQRDITMLFLWIYGCRA